MATTPVVPTNDPWAVDDKFAGLDLSKHPEDDFLTQLGNIAEQEHIPIEPSQPSQPVVVEPVQPVVTPAPQPSEDGAQPERMDLDDDGSYAILQNKPGKGWFAELHVVTPAGGKGGTEVFKGGTKNELIRNLIAGKLNATKKIRELNRKAKIGVVAVSESHPEEPVVNPFQDRQLTADEVFDLKTKMNSNPGEAIEAYVKNRYGVTLKDIIQSGQLGKTAKEELESEGVARQFMEENPEYVRSNENYIAILAYLAKNKLGKPLTNKNGEAVTTALIRGGLWTVENLTEAFEALKEQDLLELAGSSAEDEEEEIIPQPPASRVAPTPAPTPTPTPEPEPPTDPRIVRQIRRPRAGLGIRPSSVPNNVSRTDDGRPPSVEELDDLSDADIDNLMVGVRRQRASARR